MSSQSFSQLITVNLEYSGIKITKQCSDINCVKSICIRGWSGPHCAIFWVNIGTCSIYAAKCNGINKPDCPLYNQCQITNIIYKAKITTNLRNYHEKVYYGTSEGTFKQLYGNHKKSLNHEKHRTDTDLSKEYWRLIYSKQNPKYNFTF